MTGRSRRAHRGGALLASALLAVAGCSPDEAPEEPLVRPVRSEVVYATGAEVVRSFPGTAEAGTETRLSFQVPGLVAAVPVAIGDRVAAGDLVARLDPSDYELQLEDAEAALERTQAEARQAAANLRRVEELWLNRNVSRADLDEARARAEATSATVSQAEKGKALAASRLDDTRLVAPIGGAISGVTAEAGENVAAGQTVAVLSSGARPEVQVSVPEMLIDQVHEGADVVAEFDAIPGEEFPARVTEVGVTSSRGAAAFPVRVRLAGEDARVRPGMAAEVAFRFGGGDGRTRLVVPAHVVGEDRDGRFVFVVEPDGDGFATVHRRSVEIGDLLSGGLEIREGLADGERVVTAGVSRLEDGQRVRLLPTGAPAAGDGGA